MPITNNLRDVFEKVFKATMDGRATWKLGATTEALFLQMGDFLIELLKERRTVGIAGPNDRSAIGFIILDSTGSRLADFTLEPSDIDFNSLYVLFEKARQSVPSVDEKFSKFKQQLTAKLGT
jgi:hypothetical protein